MSLRVKSSVMTRITIGDNSHRRFPKSRNTPERVINTVNSLRRTAESPLDMAEMACAFVGSVCLRGACIYPAAAWVFPHPLSFSDLCWGPVGSWRSGNQAGDRARLELAPASEGLLRGEAPSKLSLLCCVTSPTPCVDKLPNIESRVAEPKKPRPRKLAEV